METSGSYQQMDIFSYLSSQKPTPRPECRRLCVGDRIGRLVLGEVEIGTIQKVEGSDTFFFYRTEKGCFRKEDRTDFEQMKKEAEEIRKRYKTVEIDHFDRFFAVRYPPREHEGHDRWAIVGIYKGMLFWKEDITYQFLQPVMNLEKEYKKKIFEITHNRSDKSKRKYEEMDGYRKIERLYYSNSMRLYAEANYVKYNP